MSSTDEPQRSDEPDDGQDYLFKNRTNHDVRFVFQYYDVNDEPVGNPIAQPVAGTGTYPPYGHPIHYGLNVRARVRVISGKASWNVADTVFGESAPSGTYYADDLPQSQRSSKNETYTIYLDGDNRLTGETFLVQVNDLVSGSSAGTFSVVGSGDPVPVYIAVNDSGYGEIEYRNITIDPQKWWPGELLSNGQNIHI
ncbi:hypothetical protein SBC1_14580 [Caballeronia sp. SBC1]|uniref:hypothetical protein n=1 Tax=unclassified Caballeronia TaxID=2646786 RepID=UPI0013E15A25|nr:MULTISPECIES: hypothetical protein [unclassified Caballeronia]QIE23571.1 hypothetical protein SBC2_15970 [Caballeronia sp. SBC2]QIN61466.1 hypothetical protein SBC1_14580 [Caballeronia sp. SBC1]